MDGTPTPDRSPLNRASSESLSDWPEPPLTDMTVSLWASEAMSTSSAATRTASSATVAVAFVTRAPPPRVKPPVRTPPDEPVETTRNWL